MESVYDFLAGIHVLELVDFLKRLLFLHLLPFWTVGVAIIVVAKKFLSRFVRLYCYNGSYCVFIPFLRNEFNNAASKLASLVNFFLLDRYVIPDSSCVTNLELLHASCSKLQQQLLIMSPQMILVDKPW